MEPCAFCEVYNIVSIIVLAIGLATVCVYAVKDDEED